MLSRYICTISRNFSCNATKTILPTFRHDYSKNEEKKILDTINECGTDELIKYNLSKARALKVSLWKSKHGSFNQVEQILELDGFGEKVLQKFCSSILENTSKSTPASQIPNIREITRKVNQYCNPRLEESLSAKIKSCLGVHVHAGSISWAKLSLHPNQPITLDTWTDLKLDDERKLHLADLVLLTKQICEKMPVADTYVLEAPIASAPSLPGKNVVQLNVNVQKSQLIGMTALGLLYKPQETLESSGQQVFFVRNFLPARLFRTKVGSERISTEDTVLDLLRYHYNIEDGNNGESISGLVNASNEVRQVFEKAEPHQRDLMGQAFLTALTFVRLCVQKCPKMIEKLEKRSN